MLQGHFIDTLLAPEFRDTTNIYFSTWQYFRGITAPTFFTISGLIFTYLLITSKKKGTVKVRIKKGLTRGGMLILIGYALRAPIFLWLAGKFNNYVLVIDVLQCIGVSLITVVAIYQLVMRKTLIFSLIMMCIGFTIFLTEPLYRGLQLPNTPLFIANYFTKSNGSIFTIIPWFGYIAFGSFIATIFYRFINKNRFKDIVIISFLLSGIILIKYSSSILVSASNVFNLSLLKDVANYNYLFIRLGNVLVIFSFFYLIENFIKHTLFLKIGQKTLSIYVIHFIIIYGSFTGLGLNTLIGKTLIPWQAVFGAIIFLSTVCFIAFYYTKTNAFVYSKLRLGFEYIKQKLYKI
ncbi:MAG: hypothetical protein BM564_13275 [Bacteroidetes bacterium MedPE-SWsnd-G2]|nr:MAG: hypothetical protein BM564_13275 [Bacteroidetes bacterium MedPE-SWsnd-G2]